MKFFREYGNLVSRENTDKIVTALVEVLSPNVKVLKCEDDSINHIVIMKTMDQIALIKRCALVSPKFAERLANSISVLINLIGLIISLFVYFNPNLNFFFKIFFFCNLNFKVYGNSWQFHLYCYCEDSLSAFLIQAVAAT